jgi:hypothetical protein
VHLPTLVGFIVLLAAFLGVQVRALFGGAEYVLATAGLTLAEYARGGFFELVAVAFIAAGVLAVIDATSQRTDPKAEQRFRVLGWTLVGLVAWFVLSAAHRMSVYVGAFGLSEDRFYAFAAMVGIAVSLGWFGLTVLRGRGERLAPGLVVWAYVWVFGLHLLNADGMVARVNIERAAAGAEFDLEYHASRSADALPALLRGATLLGTERCEALVTALAAQWTASAAGGSDWREWDYARARAVRLVGVDAEVLVAQRCGQ